MVNKEAREEAIRENIKELLSLQRQQGDIRRELEDFLTNYLILNKQIEKVASYLKHLLK